MVNYYVERTVQAVLTIVVVVTFTFGMIRLMPGGPMDYIRAQMMSQQEGQADAEQINRMVEVYTNIQPDQSIYVQYYEYFTALARGDLGTSLSYSQPVTEILVAALPWTVFVMTISLMLTFAIGISLGAVMAYLEGSRFDISSTMVSILLNSVPYYVAGVVMVYLFGYRYNWFPTGGRVAPEAALGSIDFFLSAFHHAALPIASLVITGFGIQALSMRGNSIRILGEDYLRVARLRGLPSHTIALRYVGRNAILPMYTTMMISIGFMFGGSIILEEIFAYPGLGYYMFRAINARDYPLMMGAFLIITIAVIVSIYIADLTYGKIDPRAGTGGESRETY